MIFHSHHTARFIVPVIWGVLGIEGESKMIAGVVPPTGVNLLALSSDARFWALPAGARVLVFAWPAGETGQPDACLELDERCVPVTALALGL